MLDLCRRSETEVCESVLLSDERRVLKVRLSRDDVRLVMEIGRVGFGITGDDRANVSGVDARDHSSCESVYAPGT